MIAVLDAQLYGLSVKTRMPFRYGIAVLTKVPHLFVELTVDIDGQLSKGVAADNLPPKWFVKRSKETFQEELRDMLAVINHACQSVKKLEPKASVFDTWQACYSEQKHWAKPLGYPPLLWQFGVSMVERALIDAFCQAKALPFSEALRKNAFGMDLGFFHSSLNKLEPSYFLPQNPLKTIHVRHTVGLSDPLTNADISPEDLANDTLPQSLEATLNSYGLTHLKLKLSGNTDTDFKRLESIATILSKKEKGFIFTLDGNEQYNSLADFKNFWQALSSQRSLAAFLKGLLFVEQPFSRDIALTEPLKADLLEWHTRPPIIIDESDAELDSLANALQAGYVGTSHKNCKGIFKSVANLGLINQKRLEQPERTFIMSGEDLTNIGPVALQQDLAVLASLGISHAERNGHHYFKGLSMFPESIQTASLEHHSDLYTHHDDFVSLAIHEGKLNLDTVINAPFGLEYPLDSTQFAPIEDVIKQFQS